MKPDLEPFRITERELENLTGFEVNDLFVGGILGGVYRPTVFRYPKKLLQFCLTECMVFALTFVFSLPVSLITIRSSAGLGQDMFAILQFLTLMLGLSLLAMLGWNAYMRFSARRLKILMHLLDEVDRYNEVIHAVDLLDRLEAVGQTPLNLLNRGDVLAALSVTRDTLVSGLRTEKILRENRGLLSRRYDLFANIEQNLATLRTIDVNNQANEYGQLLNEALQIGLSVHQEVQKLSR